jgi:hypothetical protein
MGHVSGEFHLIVLSISFRKSPAERDPQNGKWTKVPLFGIPLGCGILESGKNIARNRNALREAPTHEPEIPACCEK